MWINLLRYVPYINLIRQYEDLLLNLLLLLWHGLLTGCVNIILFSLKTHKKHYRRWRWWWWFSDKTSTRNAQNVFIFHITRGFLPSLMDWHGKEEVHYEWIGNFFNAPFGTWRQFILMKNFMIRERLW